ncbi:hypothetical protein BTR23_19470 [Alkalihalophilus pseudofirmus]|nr:hypothetical protein BTR23_19470 [Alkalihalophilus pseudofirmus]
MKKVVCSLIAGSFLIAGAVHAEETVIVEEVISTSDLTVYNEKDNFIEEDNSIGEADFELLGFVDVFQSTLVNLTDSEKERLTLLIEFVANTNIQLDQLLQQGQFEQAAILFEKYNQDLEYINQLIENEQQVTGEIIQEEGLDIEEELLSDIAEEVTEKTSMRGVNLLALLEREDLPDQAKAGVAKALENQKKADANRQRAKDRKEQRKAEKENRKTSEEELVDEVAEEEVTEAAKKEVKEQKEKNENAQKGQGRAEQARENAKQKAEQGQKRGHEAKEQGKSRGQEAKESTQQKGPGNANGKGNGNGNPGRP